MAGAIVTTYSSPTLPSPLTSTVNEMAASLGVCMNSTIPIVNVQRRGRVRERDGRKEGKRRRRREGSGRGRREEGEGGEWKG